MVGLPNLPQTSILDTSSLSFMNEQNHREGGKSYYRKLRVVFQITIVLRRKYTQFVIGMES